MKFNNLYNLLNEANINNLVPLLQKKFIDSLEDNTKSSYKDLDDTDKYELQRYINTKKTAYKYTINLITKNTQYQSWIYELLSNEKLIFPEDMPKTRDLLEKFEKVKKSENFKNSKNILDYKTFGDLHKVVTEFINLNRSSATLNLGNNKIIHTEGEFKVVQLDDFKDAYPLLKDTGWCVRNKEYFNDYEAPYYLILKNDRQYALMHIDSSQLKNIHDDIFHPDEVTKEFYDVILWIIKYIDVNINFKEFYISEDIAPILIKYTTDTKIIEYILDNRPSYIQYISDQMVAIKLISDKGRYNYAINFIYNPSREVQEYILSTNLVNKKFLHKIDDDIFEKYLMNLPDQEYSNIIAKISEDIQMKLVIKNPRVIININSPNKKAAEYSFDKLSKSRDPQDKRLAVFVGALLNHIDEINSVNGNYADFSQRFSNREELEKLIKKVSDIKI